jgi:hypothetical protein
VEVGVLELRPICENCAAELPPEATDAMICSFECTFCASCVTEVLEGVCPNCAGGFVPRPVRPVRDWRGGNSLATYPAARDRRHRPVDPAAHRILVASVREIPPHER